MALRLANSGWNAVLAALGTATDAGPAAAKLRVYTGTPPTDPSSGTSETLLVEFTLQDPAWTMVSGTLTLNIGTSGIAQVAVADGTPGWARIVTSDNNVVLDGTVGDDFSLNTASITLGQTVILTAGSISRP